MEVEVEVEAQLTDSSKLSAVGSSEHLPLWNVSAGMKMASPREVRER